MQISPVVPLSLTINLCSMNYIFPTTPKRLDKLRRLLPNNSSRPPMRIQAATLKRNKKATWQRFLHSLHFLRGSHGISMFSLLFVSSQWSKLTKLASYNLPVAEWMQWYYQSPIRSWVTYCCVIITTRSSLSKFHEGLSKWRKSVCSYGNVSFWSRVWTISQRSLF